MRCLGGRTLPRTLQNHVVANHRSVSEIDVLPARERRAAENAHLSAVWHAKMQRLEELIKFHGQRYLHGENRDNDVQRLK